MADIMYDITSVFLSFLLTFLFNFNVQQLIIINASSNHLLVYLLTISHITG